MAASIGVGHHVDAWEEGGPRRRLRSSLAAKLSLGLEDLGIMGDGPLDRGLEGPNLGQVGLRHRWASLAIFEFGRLARRSLALVRAGATGRPSCGKGSRETSGC